MKYKITIEELKNNPEYISIVVSWLYKEWGNHNYSYWDSWVRHSMKENDIPQTYVVFVDNHIAGTYSLWRCDLQSRQDLFPWFGGLYVDIAYRSQIYNGEKLGAILQRHAISQLKKFGYKEVYLFTSHSPEYYIRNGWKNLCHAPDENDQLVNICYRTIE